MTSYHRLQICFAGALSCLACLAACSGLTAPPAPEPIAGELAATTAAPKPTAAPTPTPAPSPTPAPTPPPVAPAPPPNPNAKITLTEMKPGAGPQAKDGDKLLILYKGSLQNGDVFDASSLHDNVPLPVELGKGGVIVGFEQALRGMKLGQKRKVVIPPELGYGSRAMGAKIPANSTLVFELELVGLNGKK